MTHHRRHAWVLVALLAVVLVAAPVRALGTGADSAMHGSRIADTRVDATDGWLVGFWGWITALFSEDNGSIVP